MEKTYYTQEQYEYLVAEYKKRSGYDIMSDDEKEQLDTKLDKILGVKESDSDYVDETDAVEGQEPEGEADPDAPRRVLVPSRSR